MSTVIKAGEAGPILRHLKTVDLADHLAEAREVVAQARREAARIVDAAKQRAHETLEQARSAGAERGYREGYEKGQVEGREAARAEALEAFRQREEQVITTLQAATAQLEQVKIDLRVNAEREVLEFATEVARRLTFAVGRSSSEAVQENFRRALELVAERTNLVVKVHPDDVEALQEFAPQVLTDTRAREGLSLVADDTVSPGGCVVEGGITAVDATLDTQLDTLVTLLLGKEKLDG